MINSTALNLGNLDPMVFAQDRGEGEQEGAAWKIMLVDDDVSIHQATKVALKFFTFEGRSLHFVSAYSAQEAKSLIQSHPDTALILLDVIMESQDAGLQVAQYIREVAQNPIVRIILRTGQPGQVPEESVVVEYDINDYKTKLELTQQKLFTTLVSSLRSYRDLLALQESQNELAQLNLELQRFNQNLEQLVAERTQALAQKNVQLTHEVQERQKAEDALRIYLHALTHDLRNPVTGMMNVVGSLLKRPTTGDDSAPQVQIPISVITRMKAGCDRQLKMINSLIETHEIEVWGIALRQQPFALETMLQGLAEEWEPSFSKKRMTAAYQIEPGVPLVYGDRNQIWRVFENLLANVIKYNPPGIAVTVTATVDADPTRLRCTVTDTGTGIDANQIPDLFKLYQRGSTRPTRGLGIGLYICRCIIEAHCGTIGINSELGAGSEFWFTLPTMREDCS
ncbi:MAG: hybrid sensor histidine kinase/response regulator [Cyanobacteria bacterium P01_A01_bin.17]